jgi:hypothetical protein
MSVDVIGVRRRRLKPGLAQVRYLGRGVQCLVEVAPEVVDVLAADAEADQGRTDALLAGERGAAFHRRLDPNQADGEVDDPRCSASAT